MTEPAVTFETAPDAEPVGSVVETLAAVLLSIDQHQSPSEDVPIETQPNNTLFFNSTFNTKESSMKLSDAFPSKYLKAADIPPGGQLRCRMNYVEVEAVDKDGNEKPVLFFQGNAKPVVLNKTNANTIAAMYGDDFDQWAGKEITLYSTTTDFQGKRVPCIRVVPEQPAPVAQPTPVAQPAPVSQPALTPEEINRELEGTDTANAVPF